MEFVAILAAVLAVAWFTRELMWRSAHAALRERLRAAATMFVKRSAAPT